VALRGVALRQPVGGPARAALRSDLDEAEKRAKVAAALERILRNVAPVKQPTAIVMCAADEAAAQAWDSANAGVWPPVYWPGTDADAELAAMYGTTRTALLLALAPPPPPPGDAAGKKGGAKPGKAGAAAPPPPPPPDLGVPDHWTRSVAHLNHLLDLLTTTVLPADTSLSALAAATVATATAGDGGDASGVAAAAAQLSLPPGADTPQQVAAVLRERLGAVLACRSTRVPADCRTLMRHAARAALLRIADLVDAKGAAVRAEYEQRVAEAAAAGDGKPAAAAAPTPAWLADKLKTGKRVLALFFWGCELQERDEPVCSGYIAARAQVAR
jgi:hypothetical protein